MAKKTVKTLLMDALEDLDDAQFKKFRNQLIDRREEPRVRRGPVQNADYMDLADKMVATFTEDGVIKVAVELFKAIGCNEIAKQLLTTTESSGSVTESTGGSSSAANMGASGKHFVDQHRAALIQRVNTLDSILDVLLEKRVITHEGYSLVRSKGTNQDKMRELYTGPLNSCGTKGKDIFYKILVENEPHLIQDLEAKLSV